MKILINNFIEKIQEYKLPLIPVESKSGGLHLYLFMNEFVQWQQ